MPQASDFSPWLKMLNLNGDQQNPAVMAQMASQAEKPDENQNGPPMTPMPQVVPAPAEKVPLTAQPTVQPLGTLPQEITPTQPSVVGPAGSGQTSQMDWMRQYLLSQKPTVSPEMEHQMHIADQNASESMQRQDAALDQQKSLAAQFARMPQRTDYRPLAAALDSWYGSKLSPAAQAIAPESPEEKLQKQVEMAKGITSATGSLTKDQLDYIRQKLQQQSYIENRQTKSDIAKNADLTKLATTGGTQDMQRARLDLQKQRLDQQVAKEARSTMNGDPILKQYVPRLEGAAKIGELIQSAKTGGVVSNQALLGQVNAEIARLETGAQSPGLGQSEKTELQDASAQLGAFRDRITGNPQDSVHPEVLDAAGKLVTELTGSYKKGIDSRFATLKAGMTPAQIQIADAKHKAVIDTYSSRLGGWTGEAQAPAGGGPGGAMSFEEWKKSQGK